MGFALFILNRGHHGFILADLGEWFCSFPIPQHPDYASPMFLPLRSVPKNYAWGTLGAMSQFTGVGRSDVPEAELWFGDHQDSQCTIMTPNGGEDFPSWLKTSDTEFPLLVKLLAASQPLSIQAHPDESEARRGLIREENAGIKIDDPQRTYKDASSKPELIIALSDEFHALWGFVPWSIINKRLDGLEAAGLSGEALSVLRESTQDSLEDFVRWVLSSDGSVNVAVSGLQEWAVKNPSSDIGASDAVDPWLVKKIADSHPGDPGILFTLVMHHVVLPRGEALFVQPGEVHAYVEGFGLEVMLPSDNVVRAGLTTKHKNALAFLELADFSSSEESPRFEPTSRGQELFYSDFGAAWEVMGLKNNADLELDETSSLIMVESGSATVEGEGISDGLSAGQVAFWAGQSGRIQTDENGHAWVVRPVSKARSEKR